MSVSSCTDASNHPLIDALEVYARPHEAGATSAARPALPSGDGSGGTRASAADDVQPSAVATNMVEALGACSRLLGHALGLATTSDPAAMGEATRGELAGSALGVLRKTCLAADRARWRALRSSSRSLLVAAQPDAALRTDSVHEAYAEEILLALVGWDGDDNTVDGGAREGQRCLSPVRLTRAAQLCLRVCAERSGLLRDMLAPALASHDDCSVGGGGTRARLSRRFVFPSVMRLFWQSCVWRRDGRDSMQMVLRCVLRLAVHEMRAAAAGAAAAAAPAAIGSSATSTDSGNVEQSSEDDVLRAGLGQLMPLLKSNVARVSQASSAYLATLLLGSLPAAAAADSSGSPSTAVAAAAAPPAATGRRRAEKSDGTRIAPSGEHGDDAGPEPRGGATAGVTLSSEAVVSGAYAGSAGSASEAEGKIETEATSDPGTDSDAEAEVDARSGSAAAASVQLALAGLRRAGHLGGAVGGGVGGNGSPAGRAAVDSALSSAAYGGLVPGSVKRARMSSSSAAAGRSRDDDSGRAADGMDVAGGAGAADRELSSAAGERARGPATGAAAAPGAPGAPGATQKRISPPTSASASSKICYRCDGCDDFPLQHVRYHCSVCADFDLCPRCYDMFHGPNSQFQGRNAVMLRDHSTSHGMVTLSVSGLFVLESCGWGTVVAMGSPHPVIEC